MNTQERDFVNDVRRAVSKYKHSYQSYHENGYFCLDITIDDIDEWSWNEEAIWNALNKIADKWGAGIDDDGRTYYLAIRL